MNIEYKLNIEEVVAFNLYYYQDSPRAKKRNNLRRISYSSISAVAFLAGIFGLLARSSFFGVICLVGGLFLLTYYYLTTKKMPDRIRQSVFRAYGTGKNSIIGKHDLSISPDGIKDITKMGETTVRWTRVKEITCSDQYLFFTIIPSRVQFVPQSAFPSEDAFKQFYDAAQEFHQKELNG